MVSCLHPGRERWGPSLNPCFCVISEVELPAYASSRMSYNRFMGFGCSGRGWSSKGMGPWESKAAFAVRPQYAKYSVSFVLVTE